MRYASVFFDRLDKAMVANGLIQDPAHLGSGQLPAALCAASEGALGTACNIIREALRIALKRNARKIDAEDISLAIDQWSIPMRFASSNPLQFTKAAA